MHSPDSTLSRSNRAILGMTQADIDRFWSKVDKTPGQGPKGECWAWLSGMTDRGYGRFGLRIDGVDIMVRAHRVAFFLAKGHLPPPDKPCACHSCDWRPCVRGDHLWAGDDLDNHADRGRKGRTAVGDRNGSRTKPERVARGERHGTHTHVEARPRGERHGNAKLTEADRPKILAAVAAGATYVEIAKWYGVNRSTIGQVARGETWHYA